MAHFECYTIYIYVVTVAAQRHLLAVLTWNAGHDVGRKQTHYLPPVVRWVFINHPLCRRCQFAAYRHTLKVGYKHIGMARTMIFNLIKEAVDNQQIVIAVVILAHSFGQSLVGTAGTQVGLHTNSQGFEALNVRGEY